MSFLGENRIWKGKGGDDIRAVEFRGHVMQKPMDHVRDPRAVGISNGEWCYYHFTRLYNVALVIEIFNNELFRLLLHSPRHISMVERTSYTSIC